MVEAAISGQGIAMSLWRFVEDDIAKNRLVPLFNYNVVTEKTILYSLPERKKEERRH